MDSHPLHYVILGLVALCGLLFAPRKRSPRDTEAWQKDLEYLLGSVGIEYAYDSVVIGQTENQIGLVLTVQGSRNSKSWMLRLTTSPRPILEMFLRVGLPLGEPIVLCLGRNTPRGGTTHRHPEYPRVKGELVVFGASQQITPTWCAGAINAASFGFFDTSRAVGSQWNVDRSGVLLTFQGIPALDRVHGYADLMEQLAAQLAEPCRE